jgi:hypothetical protein
VEFNRSTRRTGRRGSARRGRGQNRGDPVLSASGIEGLIRLSDRRREETDTIQEEMEEEYSESEEDLVVDGRFRQLAQEKLIEELTGLPEAVVLDIYRSSVPHWHASRGRGPLPKTTWLDHILILLMLYRLGCSFQDLSIRISLKLGTLEDVVSRARTILFKTLKDRWWAEKQRPKPLENTIYPHTGLIVDSTSINVFKPLGKFQEARAYFDGKNWMYALKKEIAVMAGPPHYALFSSPGFEGSRHDYDHFKQNYKSYMKYLMKSPDEKRLITTDRTNPTWSIMGDKGYVGPEIDTPNLRKIVPHKPARLEPQRQENEEIKRIRVVVECFFGLMTMVYPFVRRAYPFSLTVFDLDLDNIVLLINEHIRAFSPLAQNERNVYLQFLRAEKEKRQEKLKKRRESQKRYWNEKKRQREQFEQ